MSYCRHCGDRENHTTFDCPKNKDLKNMLPKCPKCKSNEHVRTVRCRCMSCPPYECMNCPVFDDPKSQKGYDFYDYDEYECDKCRDQGFYYIDGEKQPCICSEPQE